MIGMIPLLWMNHDAYEEEQTSEPVKEEES